MPKHCHHCRLVLIKRYKESKNQWKARKYCNRMCSAYSKSNNTAFIEKSRIRMTGNKINIGRKHLSRKSPPPMAELTRKKISEFNKGRYSGKNNHFWKGGVTPKHRRLRSSVEYKQWRETVLERDNWHCQFCGIRQGWNKSLKQQTILDVDHIKPFCSYPELRFDIDNGRTLCRDCHKKTPTWGRKAMETI